MSQLQIEQDPPLYEPNRMELLHTSARSLLESDLSEETDEQYLSRSTRTVSDADSCSRKQRATYGGEPDKLTRKQVYPGCWLVSIDYKLQQLRNLVAEDMNVLLEEYCLQLDAPFMAHLVQPSQQCPFYKIRVNSYVFAHDFQQAEETRIRKKMRLFLQMMSQISEKIELLPHMIANFHYCLRTVVEILRQFENKQ